ncbi:MAG TPA: carbon monoxide dehydrogenase subunit G [Nocardioidaceae bacterium]|nr:carbon monoxide dehydrogenase subunit G [Nocardioidaceae bacterium]
MKISGISTLTADRETVWQALTDPAVLVRTIPGCQRLEALGEDSYKMTIAAGVGSIKGVYDGQVRLTDQEQPGSFRMHAQGAGAPGTIGADVLVTLADGADGGTELTYDADATVGGMIGGVGQRMLTGVSKKMAAEFFGNVDAVLTGAVAPGSAGLPTGTGAPEPSGLASLGLPPDPSTVAPAPPVRPAGVAAGASAGQVFTAPASASDGTGASPFLLGVAVGAAAALAGAVVGGWLAGRRR